MSDSRNVIPGSGREPRGADPYNTEGRVVEDTRPVIPLGHKSYDGEEQPRMGFFTDTTVCIGCKACEVACKEWNDVPDVIGAATGHSYDNTGGLGANAWRHVAFIEQRKPAAEVPVPAMVRQCSTSVRQPSAAASRVTSSITCSSRSATVTAPTTSSTKVPATP